MYFMRVDDSNSTSEVLVDEKTGRKKYISDPTEQVIFKFVIGNLSKVLPVHVSKQGPKEYRNDHYPKAGKAADISFNSSKIISMLYLMGYIKLPQGLTFLYLKTLVLS